MSEKSVSQKEGKVVTDQGAFEVKENGIASVEEVTVVSSAPPDLSPEAKREWDKVGCLCDEHMGEVISFVCDGCVQAGCTFCCMRDHYGHKKKYVSTEGIDDGLFGHTGIFFPPEFTIEGLLKHLNGDLQTIDLRAPDAKEKIKECIQRQKSSLETQKRMLMDHVNAVKKAKLKYLQEQQRHLQKTLEELNSSVLYTRQFLDSDDSFGLLTAEKEITRRLAELNEKCSKITLPTERDWNLDKIKVIRDGKYVKVYRGKKPPLPPKPGMKTIHDPTFTPTVANVSFSMDKDVFQVFVKACCQELGEKYWLRIR